MAKTPIESVIYLCSTHKLAPSESVANPPILSVIYHCSSWKLAPSKSVAKPPHSVCNLYAQAIIITLGLGRPSAGRELMVAYDLKVEALNN